MTNYKEKKSFNFRATCIITFCLITCIFFIIFLEGCENNKEKINEEKNIIYPAVVIATNNEKEYLLIKDATGNYQRIYNKKFVVKYKAGDTIKSK